ncbi:MAG: hypothetical protein KGJ86_21975, partial [Chloroflexota bacterium]|nr:hypothetical protein [Chloroflexota bacterium]
MASRVELRQLPSVDELLRQASMAEVETQLGHEVALRSARQAIQHARTSLNETGLAPVLDVTG